MRVLTDNRVDRSFFVRFINMLLNDATYVLDEALSRFPKIGELKGLLMDTSLSPQDREKYEGELKENEDRATSYMQLSNETVRYVSAVLDVDGRVQANLIHQHDESLHHNSQRVLYYA